MLENPAHAYYISVGIYPLGPGPRNFDASSTAGACSTKLCTNKLPYSKLLLFEECRVLWQSRTYQVGQKEIEGLSANSIQGSHLSELPTFFMADKNVVTVVVQIKSYDYIIKI